MFNTQDTIELDDQSRIGDIEMVNDIFEIKNALDSRLISKEEYLQRKQRIIDKNTGTHEKNFVYVSSNFFFYKIKFSINFFFWTNKWC